MSTLRNSDAEDALSFLQSTLPSQAPVPLPPPPDPVAIVEAKRENRLHALDLKSLSIVLTERGTTIAVTTGRGSGFIEVDLHDFSDIVDRLPELAELAAREVNKEDPEYWRQ